MIRALLALCLVLCPALALATVQPPLEELQTDPALQQRWEKMAPILNDLEFKPQPKVNGPGTDSYDIIVDNLGQPSQSEARSHDLNHDGTLDQFDILELGYEARVGTKGISVAPPTGENKVFVMRADFADQDADYATHTEAYFNEMFFDSNGDPPSFNEYFSTVSYGDLTIAGGIYTGGTGGDGWFKGSQNRNWYRDTGGGARILIAESVIEADPTVDFSEFDVDGDGYVDCFMIFYPQREFAGSLWPHRSSGMNIHVDGVIIDSYFICGLANRADDMTISCHEYGHILGLPDLYDTGGAGPGTSGMGQWSLMAYQYNGAGKPPSPDPWCKIQLGWVTPEVITGNVVGKELDRFQDNRQVLKVWRNGKEEDQYFLLANYRQVLNDAPRPGQGLLIMHIDETKTGGNSDNQEGYRKHVDCCSARGWHPTYVTDPALLDHLDITSNGHANDLWRGGASPNPSPSADFSDTSNVHAKVNNYPAASTNSEISVTNMSASADTMTMDINVDTANKPTCDITAPSDGATASGSVQIDVTATPAGGRTIARVEFFCNGAYLGQDSGSPYTLTFDSRSIYQGDRAIRAVAHDSAGDIDIDEITVEVDNGAEAYPYSDDFATNVNEWAVYNMGGSGFGTNPIVYRRWQHFSASVGGRTNTAGIGSTSGGYGYNEHDELVSMRVDLTGTTAPLARWKQRFRVSSGENTVKVFITADEGASFDLLYSNTGDERNWLPVAVDLTDYIGEEVRLVFRLDSTTLSRSTGDSGWWIDDFYIKDTSDPPSVLTISPGDGSALSGNQTITVTANDDEGVAAVEFWMNGTDRIATDSSSPFAFTWNSDWVFNGAHEFTAVALDDDMQSGQASVDWTTSNNGLAVPWAEPFTSAPTSGWRIIDIGGGGSWFWGSTLGQAGGGMKFGRSSGNYDDGENDSFISPTLNLSTLADPSISFLHHYDFEQGYDFARLYVTTDLGSWTQLGSWSQTNQTAWRADGFRLDSYAGQKIKLRWLGESDTGVVEEGWWVDDLNLRSAPQITSVTPGRIQKGQTPAVTVTGTGFGTNAAIDASSLRLGSTPLTTTSWTDTQIGFTLPAGAVSNNLVVKRRGVDSDGYWLQIVLAPPVLDGLEQSE